MLINLNIEIKDASEADVKRLAEAVSVAMCATPVAVTAPAPEEPAPTPAPEEKPAPAPEEKPAPAPKKKARKKSAPAPAPAPAPEEPAPAPAPAPEEPAPAPEDGGSDEGLLDVAVKRATALLAEGDTTPVKEALKAAGARRVSQLKGDAIQVFLDALPQEA